MQGFQHLSENPQAIKVAMNTLSPNQNWPSFLRFLPKDPWEVLNTAFGVNSSFEINNGQGMCGGFRTNNDLGMARGFGTNNGLGNVGGFGTNNGLGIGGGF